MRKALTVMMLAWYFVVLDRFNVGPNRVGPFPNEAVCDAIRNFVVLNAPDQGPAQGGLTNVFGRVTPCWWIHEEVDYLNN